MSKAPPTQRTPAPDAAASRAGRPRDPEADRALLDATLELLAEVGYDSLRVNDVAERAGVAKTTMYRRWEGKSALVLAALWRAPDLADIDEGSLRADLVALLGNFVEVAGAMPIVELLASLAAERQRDASLGDALAAFVAARSTPVRRALERAVLRGEIPRAVDPAIAADVVGGAIILRLFFGGPVDERAIESIVDVVIDGLRRDGERARAASTAR